MAVPVDNEPLYRDREEARRRVYELNGWISKNKQDANTETSPAR